MTTPTETQFCQRIGGCLLKLGFSNCCCQTGDCDFQNITYMEGQLKQALAKMLPDKLYWGGNKDVSDFLSWKIEKFPYTKEVTNSELPYICWLIEGILGDEERLDYVRTLDEDVIRQFGGKYMTHFALTNASWQQRTIALAKIKNIDIILTNGTKVLSQELF